MVNYKTILLFGALGMAVAGSGVTGCSEMHEREARRTGRSSGQVITDESTDHRVRDALHNSPIYKFREVGVQTFNGVVQLNGFVDSGNQKRAAEDITRTVPGVARVVNKIAVKSEVAPTGRANGVYQAPIYDTQQKPVQQPQPYDQSLRNERNEPYQQPNQPPNTAPVNPPPNDQPR